MAHTLKAAAAQLLLLLPGPIMADAGGSTITGGDAVEGPQTDAPVNDAPASIRQWPHALPFLAQKAVDRGIDLPNPYDVGVSVYFGREDRKLRSLRLGLNGGTSTDASFVQFPNSRVEPTSLQVQAGAWVLPFLNVYALGGYMHGTGDIDIMIQGADLMSFLKGARLPAVAALRPALCSQTLAGTAHASYDGSTYGLGMTIAGAKGNFFGALPSRT